MSMVEGANYACSYANLCRVIVNRNSREERRGQHAVRMTS